MTQTPWGDAKELRARRLQPGFRLPRETVERNQRSRLLGAMVAVVAERGYEATHVSHVVELSGVSRTAFYRLFANKEECFVAAVEEIVAFVSAIASEPWRAPGSWDERLRGSFESFVGEIVAQPAAARACLVDTYVAGSGAIEHVNQGIAMFERMVRQSLEQSPERAGMPPLVVRAIVGGVHKVLMTRVRRGETDELPGLVPDLWRWAMSYETPPTPLRRRRVRGGGSTAPPRFAPRDQIERLCAAMAMQTAAHGYAATKIEDVVSTAGVSLSTFYERFGTKEDAFIAAYELGVEQASAASLPRLLESGTDWPHGVRAVEEALLDYLAAEDAWTRMGIVEALAAGPRAMELRDTAIAVFAAVLRPGLELRADLPAIAAEAIAGGIYALVYDHVRTHGTSRLAELQPVAAYFSLAPFVGARDAATIANERSPRSRS